MDKREEEQSNSLEPPTVVDVVATEDRLLPENHLSWNYILNGQLPSQNDEERTNSIESIDSDSIKPRQTDDGKSEVRSDGKQLTIDFGDIFEDEDKILMSDEDVQKLNAELAKLR